LQRGKNSEKCGSARLDPTISHVSAKDKMSLHDRLALKALEMGKTASEFNDAAHNHANATWLFIVVAGAIWYFFGWKWALIPGALAIYSAFQSVSSTMVATRLEAWGKGAKSTDSDFGKIVQAYGKILETSAPAPGTVADVSKLPYPKQRIKEAIVAALRSTDNPQLKEQLKVAYILLSSWQEDVGPENQGMDMSTLDLKQDPKLLAKEALEHSAEFEKWAAITQKEQAQLKEELLALGLW
jgi:hypothetical protein